MSTTATVFCYLTWLGVAVYARNLPCPAEQREIITELVLPFSSSVVISTLW